jgi:hypothetical protein
MNRLLSSGVALLALVVVTPAGAEAQRNAHIGVHAGYNTDVEDAVLGGQLTVPLVERLEFYPSLDIYFPDEGTRLGFNGDLKYGVPLGGTSWFYFGGGLNVLYRDVADASDSDLGVNLIGGLEGRGGTVHPFGELRVMLHDNTLLQLAGGVNITLGR